MKTLFLFIAFVYAFLSSGSVFAQSSSSWGRQSFFDGREILLPNPGNSVPSLKLISSSETSQKFKRFSDNYGHWVFLVDRQTGIVQRAFGDAVKLLDDVNKNNIINASKSFIVENADIFGISNVADLRLSRVKNVNGRWYVSYKQYYRGVEILLSEIELRIFDNGNLSNFGMIYFPVGDIDVTNFKISRQEAEQFAKIGIGFNPLTDVSKINQDVYILPYTTLAHTEYRVVYKVDIETAEPYAHYFAYVDANTGETLWRQNMVFNSNKFSTAGFVKPKFGQDKPILLPFADMGVTIDGDKYVTDENGEFQFEISDSSDLNARFISDWAKVTIRRGPRTTADYNEVIAPGEDFTLNWDDENSHKTERNLFYHANFVHDYIRALDTGLKVLDFQLKITIDFNGQNPNAFSGGKTIGYIGVGVPTMRLAECAQILYHEYGHTVNAFLYQSEGAGNGMLNSSCNEGHADLFSAMIQDEPRMGVGAWVNDSNKIIRNLKNKLVYPDDIEGDGHHNGMILGGAYWDLREATSLEYVRQLSHFTKYGLPDDPDVGKAFSEWFIETLNTDDDDGDISNGTPNLIQIIKAFNAHQIGTGLFLKYGFEHNQHPDTKEVEQPYVIDFKLHSLPLPGGEPDSILVFWSIDDFQTVNILTAELQDKDAELYRVLIPAQKAGTIIKYYMHAWEPISENPIDFYKSFNGKKPFNFLVGFRKVSSDDFENSDWSVGSSGDNATRGKWENNIPYLVDLSNVGYGQLQPGKDFSNPGVKCWVTGARGSNVQYYQFMPNGRTTLTSTDYDISLLMKPIIKYQRWFYNLYGIPTPGYETYWRTYLSFDSGATWVSVEETKEGTDRWEATYIPLFDYISENTKIVRVKFVFDVPYSNQIISLNEGLVDDFEILSIDETLVSVDELRTDDNFVEVYPNPVSNSATFRFKSSLDDNSSLFIYNVLGVRVKTFSGLSSRYTINWDGTDDYGVNLNSGVYIYKLFNNGDIKSGKIIIE